MKAVQLQDVGEVAFGDVHDLESSNGEAIVKVTAAGMCGSDRHIVSGEYPGSPPVILGPINSTHEGACRSWSSTAKSHW